MPRIDLENGWVVRVTEVQGRPFITVTYDNGNLIAANSCVVELDMHNVVTFKKWHNYKHEEEID